MLLLLFARMLLKRANRLAAVLGAAPLTSGAGLASVDSVEEAPLIVNFSLGGAVVYMLGADILRL